MGLDSYLIKKSYVKQWEHQSPEEKHVVVVTKGGKPSKTIKSTRISYIEEEIGYWRKANAIHKWFVDNIQDGIDDCGEYRVNADDFANLLGICKEVIAHPDKASTLLPVQAGFFFGSTDYDEYYIHSVQNTINILEDILSERCLDQNGREFFSGDYYYSSSW